MVVLFESLPFSLIADFGLSVILNAVLAAAFVRGWRATPKARPRPVYHIGQKGRDTGRLNHRRLVRRCAPRAFGRRLWLDNIGWRENWLARQEASPSNKR